MGVFRRSHRAGKVVSAKTVIASGCQINGQITLSGDLHLDGRIDGNVVVNQLSIGKEGHLKGVVRAQHIIVSGQLEGSIECDLLELLDGCQVTGDVCCQDLVIEKGARFIGRTTEAKEKTIKVLPVEEPKQLTNQTSVDASADHLIHSSTDHEEKKENV